MILQHLRYSPVNGMIVTWGRGATSFSACGLPTPTRKLDTIPATPAEEQCCTTEQILQEINWSDWGRWLPEVGIGVEDFDEEVAAAYVREAAIEFAVESRVLQRSVFVQLQEGVHAYPLMPAENERIVGVLAVLDGGYRLRTGGARWEEMGAVMRHGSNEVILTPELVHQTCCCNRRKAPVIELLVWSAPTEDACLHDSLLYEEHRRMIAAYGRALYLSAMHYTNTNLLRLQMPASEFRAYCRKVRSRATAWLGHQAKHRGSGRMWG